MTFDLPHPALWLDIGERWAIGAHIVGGSVSILSGAVAIFAKKGAGVHRAAGTAFFAAMVLATVSAGLVAPFQEIARWTNTTAAVFTLYLVTTSWATVRRGAMKTGVFERLALVFAGGLAAMGIGLAALHAGTPRAEGFIFVWVFCTIAALAAICDARVLRAGGLDGPARTARHLWRMSLALLIAVLSFFVGQQKVMPEWMRGHPALYAPVIIVFVLMVFWLVRVWFSKAWKSAPA